MNAELEKRLNKLDYLFKKIENDVTTSDHKEGDARYDILNYLLKEINNYGIAEQAATEYFYYRNDINEESKNKYFNEFVNSYKDKFFIMTYSYIEVFVRQIAYKKYPETKKDAPISKIVDNKMNFTNDESKELWEIYASIRNSIHNLKHIYEDKSIEYKNKEYKFIKGKHIEGFDFDNILFIFEEIYDNVVIDLINQSKDIDYVESVFFKNSISN